MPKEVLRKKWKRFLFLNVLHHGQENCVWQGEEEGGGVMCELENMKCIFACRLGCLFGKRVGLLVKSRKLRAHLPKRRLLYRVHTIQSSHSSLAFTLAEAHTTLYPLLCLSLADAIRF
jgi:hypothetical protein